MVGVFVVASAAGAADGGEFVGEWRRAWAALVCACGCVAV